MSYPLDLDEELEPALRREIARRESARASGLCDYCGRVLASEPCKFPDRHRASPVQGESAPLDDAKEVEALKAAVAFFDDFFSLVEIKALLGDKRWGSIRSEYIAHSRNFAVIADRHDRLASHPAPSAGTPTETLVCEECEESPATEALESGEDLCKSCYIERLEMLCTRYQNDTKGARAAAIEECVATCKAQLTGFASELHEAYDNGVKDCIRFVEQLRALRASPSLVLPREAVLSEEWAIYEREPSEGERSVVMTFPSEDSAVEYMADTFGDDPDNARTVDIVPCYIVRRSALTVAPARDTE